MPNKRALILAGTAEARSLANAFFDLDVDVISSFAGVTEKPVLPSGKVRVGNFGGVEGLADFLKLEGITHLIDATHPFAAQMSAHAVAAARLTKTPLVRFERPPWREEDGEVWTKVENLEQAANALPDGAHVLLTTGRKELTAFFERQQVTGVIRTIEQPSGPLPSGWALLQDRPPYSVSAESRLLADGNFTHLVTKNAGGNSTSAKLAAAQRCGVHVIMVERPAKPECLTVERLDDVISWVLG